MTHTVPASRTRRPNRRADARTQITAATYESQIRVIARELIDAGVTPAEMTVWVSLRPSMHRIAAVVTRELAAAR